VTKKTVNCVIVHPYSTLPSDKSRSPLSKKVLGREGLSQTSNWAPNLMPVHNVVLYDECIKKDERSENFHTMNERVARELIRALQHIRHVCCLRRDSRVGVPSQENERLEGVRISLTRTS